MGTGVSFRIWSPGKDPGGPVKTRLGRFVVGCDGSSERPSAAFAIPGHSKMSSLRSGLVSRPSESFSLLVPCGTSDNYTGEL